MLAFKTKLHYTHDETIRLNEFSKNARYEVNIRKFAVVLQISNKQSEQEVNKNSFIYSRIKKARHLAMNLTEEM